MDGHVVRGRWVDPYTDQIFTESSNLAVDHLAPLYWYCKGAHGRDGLKVAIPEGIPDTKAGAFHAATGGSEDYLPVDPNDKQFLRLECFPVLLNESIRMVTSAVLLMAKHY